MLKFEINYGFLKSSKQLQAVLILSAGTYSELLKPAKVLTVQIHEIILPAGSFYIE